MHSRALKAMSFAGWSPCCPGSHIRGSTPRWRSCWIMRSRGGIDAASHVERWANAGSAATRRAVAITLGRIGSPSSVATLVALLRDETDPTTLVAIAGALGAIGDRRGFTPLLALLDHDEA